MNTTIHIIEQLKGNQLMLQLIHIDSNKEVNDKDPKFKVGSHIGISKDKNIFAKGYTPNWFEKVFVIKEVKNTVLSAYVINDLSGEEITGKSYEKNYKKRI